MDSPSQKVSLDLYYDDDDGHCVCSGENDGPHGADNDGPDDIDNRGHLLLFPLDSPSQKVALDLYCENDGHHGGDNDGHRGGETGGRLLDSPSQKVTVSILAE